MSGDSFPIKLGQKPSCRLTRQWSETGDSSTTTRYAGADGYVYEKRVDGWFKVGRNDNSDSVKTGTITRILQRVRDFFMGPPKE
jgi:hypothetical protein